MRLLRWDRLVEMEPDDWPFCGAQACLEICDLAQKLQVIFVGSLFSHRKDSFIALEHAGLQLQYTSASTSRAFNPIQSAI
jgi:hypothetical protein